jgi:hypothetical protein
VQRREDSAMVIFMLIMAYCISYGIVKNDDTEKYVHIDNKIHWQMKV